MPKRSKKVKADAELSEEDAKKKQADIEEIEKTILASDDTYASLVKELKESQQQKGRDEHGVQGLL